jgi:uncharacterized cupredoxin-like copper-binding protein
MTMATARSNRSAVTTTVASVLALLLGCAVLVILGLLARPSGGLNIPAGSHVVHVDEHDFGIQVSTTILTAGNYVFVDHNHGPSSHELVMWKTNLDAAQLPRGADGKVNEDSSQLDSVLDSGSSLHPGEIRLLTTSLEPGHYVMVCNLPGHYNAGMHVDITVK